MTRNLPRFLFFVSGIAVYLFLYWPSLQGTPIWDDNLYWFHHPFNRADFSMETIWRFFTWPLSVSLQKILSSWWGKNYLNYHLFNLLLHLVNSTLLYHVLKKLKVDHAQWVWLFFLVHPGNVTSVAWMIQNKTLLTGTACLLSLMALLRASTSKVWYLVSWILFLAAVLSKASALIFPVILIFVVFSKTRNKEMLWLTPFLLISLWGGYRLFQSPVTKQGLAHLIESKASAPVTSTLEKTPTPTKENIVTEEASHSLISAPVASAPLAKSDHPLENITLKNLYYYFWQALYPTNLVPVKAHLGKDFEIFGIVQLLLFIGLVLFFWKDFLLLPILAAHVMLLPYLGIVPAPFMNMSLVSDQHLYLALPFFLIAFITFVFRLRSSLCWPILTFFLVFHIYKTRDITPVYQHEHTFYQVILDNDPENVAIAFNYCSSLLNEGKLEEALDIGDHFFEMAKRDAKIRESRYYPHLFNLYLKMKTLKRAP